MRVVAGEARGRPLVAPRRGGTRPTADHIKEAIFSMLESLLAAAHPSAAIGSVELWQDLAVLDLYAGSGALGIEALSRGASHATFLDASAAAVDAVRRNLRATDLADRAAVRPGDVRRGLRSLTGPFDLVLADPPYADETVIDLLESIERAPWLAADALVVLEHSRRRAIPDTLRTLMMQRNRRHGETVVTIFGRGRLDRASTGRTPARGLPHDEAQPALGGG